VVPERGQVGGDVVESESKQPCDVLHEAPLGSKYAKASGELGPQPPVVVQATARPGVGDGLAGESSANKVRGSHPFPLDGSHVAEVGDIGPVAGEHG
jgi:hypothetical protein